MIKSRCSPDACNKFWLTHTSAVNEWSRACYSDSFRDAHKLEVFWVYQCDMELSLLCKRNKQLLKKNLYRPKYSWVWTNQQDLHCEKKKVKPLHKPNRQQCIRGARWSGGSGGTVSPGSKLWLLFSFGQIDYLDIIGFQKCLGTSGLPVSDCMNWCMSTKLQYDP